LLPRALAWKMFSNGIPTQSFRPIGGGLCKRKMHTASEVLTCSLAPSHYCEHIPTYNRKKSMVSRAIIACQIAGAWMLSPRNLTTSCRMPDLKYGPNLWPPQEYLPSGTCQSSIQCILKSAFEQIASKPFQRSIPTDPYSPNELCSKMRSSAAWGPDLVTDRMPSRGLDQDFAPSCKKMKALD